jgi:8-oxo-dGTP pyrophosphatase MutT (NUDIX family)
MTVYARRSVRVLVLDSTDRLLLIRSALVADEPAHGFAWFTPGGGIEPGEELADTAVRELREEVGLAVEPADLHPVAFASGHAELGWANGLFRDDFFLCRVDSHDVDTTGQTPLERTHYNGYRWWTLAELASTTEAVYPFGLAGLLDDLVGGRVPAVPVELPWHH